MGCGSSTLKGEKVDDLAPQPTQGINRVRTNFSDVDFRGENGAHRRGTVALAPDEQHKPSRISETVPERDEPEDPLSRAGAGTHDGIVADGKAHPGEDGQPLKPYHTIDGDTDALASPTEIRAPQFNTASMDDPTSSTSKAAFANANQPGGSQLEGRSLLAAGSEITSPERKRSWLQKIAANSQGSGMGSVSDEEFQRATGMTREQFDVWKNDPNNAVGPRQPALTVASIGGAPIG